MDMDLDQDWNLPCLDLARSIRFDVHRKAVASWSSPPSGDGQPLTASRNSPSPINCSALKYRIYILSRLLQSLHMYLLLRRVF